MKKLIILLLCCGVLVSMVGCGGNTAPPPTESPPTTVSETIITETPPETIPPVAAVEQTEKEKEPVPAESKEQATEPTVAVAEPTTIAPIEETETTVASIAEEKATPLIEETVPSSTPQLTEIISTATEPPKEESKAETEAPKVTEPKPTEKPAPFVIDYWITFAKEYAVSIGLKLDGTAVDCWDNPIRAGAHCIYLERDIQSRLDHYAKDEDITDAELFKLRMDTEVGFLSELNGLFSNRTEWHPRPMFEATEENCEAFRLWLEVLWAELPEALSTQTAAELVGHNPQRIHELIKEEVLHGVKIGSTQYCVKEEFICYMASPQKLSNPRTDRYKELIREFKYIQRRERENAQRRIKRKKERGEIFYEEENLDTRTDSRKT